MLPMLQTQKGASEWGNRVDIGGVSTSQTCLLVDWPSTRSLRSSLSLQRRPGTDGCSKITARSLVHKNYLSNMDYRSREVSWASFRIKVDFHGIPMKKNPFPYFDCFFFCHRGSSYEHERMVPFFFIWSGRVAPTGPRLHSFVFFVKKILHDFW